MYEDLLMTLARQSVSNSPIIRFEGDDGDADLIIDVAYAASLARKFHRSAPSREEMTQLLAARLVLDAVRHELAALAAVSYDHGLFAEACREVHDSTSNAVLPKYPQRPWYKTSHQQHRVLREQWRVFEELHAAMLDDVKWHMMRSRHA